MCTVVTRYAEQRVGRRSLIIGRAARNGRVLILLMLKTESWLYVQYSEEVELKSMNDVDRLWESVARIDSVKWLSEKMTNGLRG